MQATENNIELKYADGCSLVAHTLEALETNAFLLQTHASLGVMLMHAPLVFNVDAKGSPTTPDHMPDHIHSMDGS